MAFKGKLFTAQQPGAEFLCSKKWTGLCSEQGTGKTVITIAAAEKLLELGLAKRILVICPSGITWQWEDKIKEFSDSETTLIYAKRGRERSYATTTPYTITSYNLFRRDFERIAKEPWDVVVCDEAQEFKNNKSKTAKLLKQLNQEVRPRWKWALTGTIVGTKLEELFSIMYWIDPAFFPPWPAFEARHIVRNPKTQQIMRYKDIEVIARSLPKRIFRITQKDLDGQTPELLENIHYIEKESELLHAELALLDVLDELALDFSGNASRDPRAGSAFSDVLRMLASPKKITYAHSLAEHILEENPTNRVVIFSRYKEPLYALRGELQSPSFYFTGDQSTDEKRNSVAQFERGPSVLLCSNAGKAGLDLPFANYLLHLDVPFSHEVLDQRNYRIARANSVHATSYVNYLIVKHSIEEYYYRVVKQRGVLAKAIHSGDLDTITMRTESLRNFIHDKLGAD